MAAERIIEDKELGWVFIRVNSRAKKLIFRAKDGVIHVTVPTGTTLAEVKKAIEIGRAHV